MDRYFDQVRDERQANATVLDDLYSRPAMRSLRSSLYERARSIHFQRFKKPILCFVVGHFAQSNFFTTHLKGASTDNRYRTHIMMTVSQQEIWYQRTSNYDVT